MRTLAATVVLLVMVGCKTTPPAPPPSDVASAPKLGEATTKQQSKASAAVSAAKVANGHNPDGPAKVATNGALQVASANLPRPSKEDEKEAMAPVESALNGDMAKAQEKWSKAIADAATLSAKIASLEQQVAAEKIAAAQELQRQLKAARDEERQKAAAEQRRLVSWIFFGGAFLLAVAGAVVLGTTQYVPLFGPKLAISLGIAAAASAVLGVAINELLAHPWVIWALLGLMIAGIAGAVVLGVSNLDHHKTQDKP